MKRIGPGRFEVFAGEQITVKIEKSKGQWLAAVSDLDNATWAPKPASGTTGAFRSPTKSGDEASFAVLYDFVPGGDPDGDFYTITISGETGDPNTTFVDAPALQHRTYTFEVA
jgi:hypothetical protein